MQLAAAVLPTVELALAGQVRQVALAVGEYFPAGWTVPKQEVSEVVRESWMWESGKDEYVHTSVGPQATS